MATDSFDVAVIGGGVAGLSAALTLGRARRTVKVIDEGRPRNAPAAHSHGCLTRDGFPPLELVSLGRAEVATHGVEVIADRAHSIERLDSGSFEVRTAGGRGLESRRLLAATGLVDQLPSIPGLRKRWGRDVVHCPFCFGWEISDLPLAGDGEEPRQEWIANRRRLAGSIAEIEKVRQQAAEILLEQAGPHPASNSGVQTTRRSPRTRSRPH